MRELSEPAVGPVISSPAQHSGDLALYAADGSGEHLPARLLGRQPGLYQLLVPVSIETGRRLVMVDGSYRYEVEVQASARHASGKFAVDCTIRSCRQGIIRQEWRMPSNIRASLTDPLSGAIQQVRIRDISPFGMGLIVPAPLLVGTAVVVDTKDGIGYGEVRYCRAHTDQAFLAGLYLRDYIEKPDSLLRAALLLPMKRTLRVWGRYLRSTRFHFLPIRTTRVP